MTKREMSREFRVGLFVVLGIVVILLFVFSEGRLAQMKGYEIRATFNYVGGLEVGAPVRVSGVRVGEVTGLDISYETTPKVTVTIKLQPQIKIGRHSQITIRTLGMIGEKYVEITPSRDRDFLVAGASIEGVDAIALERMMSMTEDIIRNLNDVLVGVRTMVADTESQENVKSILSNLDQAVQTGSRFMENVGQMTTALVERVDRISGSLEETSREVRTLISDNRSRVESVLDGMTHLTRDGGKVLAKVGERVDELQGIGDRMKETADAYRRTAEEAGALFDDLRTRGFVADVLNDRNLFAEMKREVALLQDTTRQFGKTAESANVALADLNGIISHMRSGEGSLGKLLMDEELYRDIQDLVRNPWKMLIRRRSP